MTTGIGLPYINIAVAESAVRLARSFHVTLCKLQVRANTNIVRLANGLARLQERLAFTMPINIGRVQYSILDGTSRNVAGIWGGVESVT